MFLRVFQHIPLEHIGTYQNSTPKQATVYEGIPPSFGIHLGHSLGYAYQGYVGVPKAFASFLLLLLEVRQDFVVKKCIMTRL